MVAFSIAGACSERSKQQPCAIAGAGGGDYSWDGGGGALDAGGLSSNAEAGAGGVSGQGGASFDGGGDASIGAAGGLDAGPGNTGNKVTFYEGQARGAMTGRGWVAMGPFETMLGPQCPSVRPSPSLVCNSPGTNYTTLCADGPVPTYQALDPTPAPGLLVAVYATEPPGEGLGQSFQSITVGFTALPTRGTQLYVHRKGDPRDTVYRAYISSPGTMSASVTVAFSALSIAPWGPDAGSALSPEDVPNLDWIGVFIPSGVETTATLCLTRVEFL
jgi:hypothetical protein